MNINDNITDDVDNNMFEKTDHVSEQQPKKRGRPRKNLIDKSGRSIDKKKITVDLNKQKELILHLPYITMNSKKQPSESEAANTITAKEIEIKDKDTLLVISDGDEKSSDESDDLREEIKSRDKIIKKLRDELNSYKSMMSDHCVTASKEVKTYPMNIRLVESVNNKPVIVEKTNIACWWCTYEFDTMPCFIPERYDRDVFYIFGCFCSFNCAAAYNDDLSDYKKRDRYSLLKKLYQMLYGVDEDITLADDRKVLQKYGGTVSIEEYRRNSITNKKEYKILMPPFVPIIPYIEERTKDKVTKTTVKYEASKQAIIVQDKNIFNSLGASVNA